MTLLSLIKGKSLPSHPSGNFQRTPFSLPEKITYLQFFGPGLSSDDVTAKQTNQSIDLIISIDNGETCTSEPESLSLLARIVEVELTRFGGHLII